MMGHLLLWIIALALGHTQAASIPECCKEKTVGDVAYVLVDETDTKKYGCKSNCIFERKDRPGPRFCFKDGSLKVACGGGGAGGDGFCKEMIPCDEDSRFCDNQVPSCNGTGWVCDSNGCQYDSEQDSSINQHPEKEKIHELVDFLTDHFVPMDGKGTISGFNQCASASCSEGEGDCDNDYECKNDLVCGKDSCQHFHVFADPRSDCCMKRVGAAGSHSDKRPFDIGHGPCMNDTDCKEGSVCGTGHCMGTRGSSCCMHDGIIRASDLLDIEKINEHFATAPDNEETQERAELLLILAQVLNEANKQKELKTNRTKTRTISRNVDWIKQTVDNHPDRNTMADFLLPGAHHPGLEKGMSRYIGILQGSGTAVLQAVAAALHKADLFAICSHVSWWDLPLKLICKELDELVKLTASKASSVILNLAVTQDISFEEQLNIGTRFFDVRLTTFEGDLYTSHGQDHWFACIGIKFDDVLLTTNKFLEANPGEFIVWTLRWEYGTPDWTSVEEKLKKYPTLFNIVNRSSPKLFTYADIKGKITICVRHKNSGLPNYRHLDQNGSYVESTKTSGQLISVMNNFIQNSNGNNFDFLEAVITPVTSIKDLGNILEAGIGYTLVDFAHKLNKDLESNFFPSFLKPPYHSKVEAMMFDGVSQDIVDKIVTYNVH